MLRILPLSALSLVSHEARSGLFGLSSSRLLIRPARFVVRQHKFIFTSLVERKRQDQSSSSYYKADGEKKGSPRDVSDETMEGNNVRTRSQAKANSEKDEITDRSNINPVESATNMRTLRNESYDDPNSLCTNDGLDHRAVRHDKNSKQFLLDLGDNQTARIEYKQIRANYIELYHTEVPEKVRGKGIGRILARGALENASRAKFKLKVTCEYLQHYLDHYADEEHRKLVVD